MFWFDGTVEPYLHNIMTAHNNNRNRTDRLICIACVSAGCILMFLNERFGLPGRDELYQTICVRRYDESPLGLLSYWIGNIWVKTFGFTFINLRILTSLMEVIAASITSAYLFKMTRNLRLTSLIFLLVCTITRLGNINIYNWDTGAYPYMALTLVFTISSLSRPTYLKYFLVGAGTALMMLARTPSVIFLPFAMGLVWAYNREKVELRQNVLSEITIFAGFIFSFVIFTTIIVGSPLHYIQLFSSDHIITGHSPSEDPGRLWHRFLDITRWIPIKWAFVAGSIAISVLLPKLKSRLSAIIILAGWILICSLCSYWYSRSASCIQLELGFDSLLGIALLLAIPVYSLFATNLEIKRNLKYKLWACAFLIFSVGFGSDGYFERLTSSFSLPVIFGILWYFNNSGFHKFLKTIIFVCLPTFVSMLVIFEFGLWNNLKNEPTARDDIFAYRGLQFKSSDPDIAYDAFPAINHLRETGVPYAAIGDQMLNELVTGSDEGIPYHNFHHIPGSPIHWFKYKDEFVDKIDAVVFNPKNHDYGYIEIMDYMKTQGFTDSVYYGDAIIVYRSPRKNPDKNYPILQPDGLTFK